MRARSSCSIPGCPKLAERRGKCGDHVREWERGRPTAHARGYDGAHRQERLRWTYPVEAGVVRCSRCGLLIEPGTPWDLGHTDDRTAWTGPEHANECNRAAAGRAAHRN